jgi:anti-sigma regulatory factor (Ser/Thr protein kinase)
MAGAGEVVMEVIDSGARRGVRLVFKDQGQASRMFRQPCETVHDWIRAWWLTTALERIFHRIEGGNGHQSDDCALEIVIASLIVNDESQIAEARREATAMARRQGSNEVDAGRVALVTNELATNLVKHARGGEILVGPDEGGGRGGVLVLSLDKGPGMANVQACLEDGYSSAGTAGNGLGAVTRMSALVDIASRQGVGTAVLAVIDPGKARVEHSPRPAFGALSVAKLGEDVCGDAWAVDQNGTSTTLFVADGLGHGPVAAEAAVEAVRLFRRFRGHQVTTLLDCVDNGLRSTRGATISMARYDPFAGGLVILCSDGISSSWTLDRYPNLETLHPTLIAAVLYRDFGRRRDDATVLVGKWVAHA